MASTEVVLDHPEPETWDAESLTYTSEVRMWAGSGWKYGGMSLSECTGLWDEPVQTQTQCGTVAPTRLSKVYRDSSLVPRLPSFPSDVVG